jgi:cytochrome c oxidase subunit 4
MVALVYYVAYGPHGPRTPKNPPGTVVKVLLGTMGLLSISGLVFQLIRSQGLGFSSFQPFADL